MANVPPTDKAITEINHVACCLHNHIFYLPPGRVKSNFSDLIVNQHHKLEKKIIHPIQ